MVKIDFERLKKSGIITPDAVNMTLSEQYRRIKLPILENAFGRNALGVSNRNLVMVSSSIQNEGKSFTSINLAMSIAKEFNHTVLYIDADITQRMLNKFLGFTEKAGLVDYLVDGDCDLSKLLLKTTSYKSRRLLPGRVNRLLRNRRRESSCRLAISI